MHLLELCSPPVFHDAGPEHGRSAKAFTLSPLPHVHLLWKAWTQTVFSSEPLQRFSGEAIAEKLLVTSEATTAADATNTQWMDSYIRSSACLFFFLLFSTLFSSRKIPTWRLSHTALPSTHPAGIAVQRGTDLLQFLFCHSRRFVIWVPSNSALSYMINSCYMWLVLSDPLCRGRIWAFAREKETYVGFKSSVQMNRKDWSQISAGWLFCFFF